MKNTFTLPKPTIPTINYTDAKAIYTAKDKLEGFRANMKATRNDFLRNTLFHRQHGLCPCCGKRLLNVYAGTAVHHTSYDNYCTFTEPLIHIYSPQDNAIQAKVPNCKVCYFKYPEKAEACLSNLVMVHKTCHELMHGHTERLKTQN